MSFFVTCTSEECPRKQSCGRYTHYTDQKYASDFRANDSCTSEWDYVMQLTPREVEANTMAKPKDGVKSRKVRK